VGNSDFALLPGQREHSLERKDAAIDSPRAKGALLLTINELVN